MKLLRLGGSDLHVSRVGLGCNNFGPMIAPGMDAAAVRGVVHAALDVGVTFFDTAEIYSAGMSEQLLGEALKGHRDEAVIATKFGGRPEPDDDLATGSPAYIRAAIDKSLARLGTDHVDLYYYHRPDGVTPIEETLVALHELVQAGKTRAIGCSNFSAEQLAEADDVSRAQGITRFVAIQNQYSLIERDADLELLPLCRELEIGLVPYFPLASGLLTGKYRRDEPPPDGTRLAGPMGARVLNEEAFDMIEELGAFAAARGHSLQELAIAGVAAQPGVTGVIAGAKTPEQVQANARAAEWELDAGELADLPSFVGAGLHF